MVFDPNAAAKAWSDGLAAAANSGKIRDGINGVTISPGQAAARQKQVWAQNTAAAVDRWAANTAAVTLESWKSDAINKGVQRVAAGAANAEPKMVAFMNKLAPVINSAKQNLPPRGTFQQNLTRANAMATALHNAKGSFK